MNKAEQQEVERDLQEYKDELRAIQLRVLDLMRRIDMDTFQRRRTTDD